MKHIYVLFVLTTLFRFQANSQELIADTGLSFTSFEFENSQGESLDNLQATTNNYISLGYRQDVLKDILHIIGGLGISSYGATGSDNEVNNYFNWETTYLGIYLGLDVKVYKTNKLSFYLRGTSSSEFILQGTQTLNNQVFDLKGIEEFDSANFFFRGGLLMQYDVTETFSIFTKYTYGKSTGTGIDEELKYKSHDVGFGLVINIAKKEIKNNNQKQK